MPDIEPLTAERLAAIRARVDATTGGAWEYDAALRQLDAVWPGTGIVENIAVYAGPADGGVA